MNPVHHKMYRIHKIKREIKCVKSNVKKVGMNFWCLVVQKQDLKIWTASLLTHYCLCILEVKKKL